MTLDELRRVVPAGCLIEGPSTVTMIMVTVTPTSLMRDVVRSQAVMLLAGIALVFWSKCGVLFLSHVRLAPLIRRGTRNLKNP